METTVITFEDPEHAVLLSQVLKRSGETGEQWFKRMVRECRVRQLILDYIDVEYSAYCAAQIAIKKVALMRQFDGPAIKAGAQAGDWLLETDDGFATEVVRIVDWTVVSIHRRHEFPADWR